MLRTIAAAWLALSVAATGATAAEAGKIAVEFNDLQQSPEGCRAVFVMNNGLEKPLDKVAFRVVAFDKNGKAVLFLSLDVGALPTGKTRILRFDLGGELPCENVGRVVLDDVTSCEGEAIGPPECLAAVSLSSRAGVPFDF